MQSYPLIFPVLETISIINLSFIKLNTKPNLKLLELYHYQTK